MFTLFGVQSPAFVLDVQTIGEKMQYLVKVMSLEDVEAVKDSNWIEEGRAFLNDILESIRGGKTVYEVDWIGPFREPVGAKLGDLTIDSVDSMLRRIDLNNGQRTKFVRLLDLSGLHKNENSMLVIV